MGRDKTVEVVLVGCGAVSQTMYAPALRALEENGDVMVVAVVDPAERQRAKLRSTFLGAGEYSELGSCALGKQNLVVVATPPKLHAEQSIYALRQGATVLCEKPMAVSSVDAERMIDAAAASSSLLAVGIYRRFLPAFEALADVFAKQPLGQLESFAIQEGGKFAWGAASDSFFRRDQTLGGVFFDVGVYVVDVLLWWLGEPVTFKYEDDAMGGLEANCRLDLAYHHGAHGTVRLSRDWQTRNTYTFRFERGAISYQVGQGNRLTVSFDGIPFSFTGDLASTAVSGDIEMPDPTRTPTQSFTEQLRNVVGAMKGEQTLRVPGEEAIRSLRFIERCYRTRRLMDMPWLTDGEKSSAEAMARGER